MNANRTSSERSGNRLRAAEADVPGGAIEAFPRSTSNARAQFLDTMRAAGIGAPRELVADGELHRFQGDGDRKGAKNAWYLLHCNGRPAGAFGSWRLDIRETWCSGGDGRTLTRAERKRLAAQIAEAKRQAETDRQATHEATAAYAGRLWHDGGPADSRHGYLIAKQVGPHELRQDGNLLLVPLRDLDGRLWNLQTIAENGAKRFLKGGRVTGLASPIGSLEEPERLLICEGWSTGATLHEATGSPVLASMNAGNLRPVAVAAHERWPEADIVVAADNDRHTSGNPGLTAATKAASVIGARLMVPEFADDVPGSDWNDFYIAMRWRLGRRAVA